MGHGTQHHHLPVSSPRPMGSSVRKVACKEGYPSSTPRSGKIPGERDRQDYPFQTSLDSSVVAQTAESTCNEGDRVYPGLGRSWKRGHGSPTPVLFGQTSEMFWRDGEDREAWHAASPWSRKGLDMTEQQTKTEPPIFVSNPINNTSLISPVGVCCLFAGACPLDLQHLSIQFPNHRVSRLWVLHGTVRGSDTGLMAARDQLWLMRH